MQISWSSTVVNTSFQQSLPSSSTRILPRALPLFRKKEWNIPWIYGTVSRIHGSHQISENRGPVTVDNICPTILSRFPRCTKRTKLTGLMGQTLRNCGQHLVSDANVFESMIGKDTNAFLEFSLWLRDGDILQHLSRLLFPIGGFYLGVPGPWFLSKCCLFNSEKVSSPSEPFSLP